MKNIRSIWLPALLCIYGCPKLSAQKKDSLRSIVFYEDNDFFNFRGEGTDRYYTNGTRIGLYYTKGRKRKWWDKPLVLLTAQGNALYGWELVQDMYTPSNISASQILIGDRPYAGVLYLAHHLQSLDASIKARLSTAFDIGVIGPWAFAGEFQDLVHHLIAYQQAMGWSNQIANDIVLEYRILYEKLLHEVRKRLELSGFLEANGGTLFNQAGAGFQFRVGWLMPGFEAPQGHGFQAYYFMRALGRAVLDNATLEGGFFTHDQSPYVISKDQLERIYVQAEYGLAIGKGRWMLSASERVRTKEFQTAYAQQVGNISLTYAFL